MPGIPFLNKVMVSTNSMESNEPYDIVGSNISVVNMLFKEYLTADEICGDALTSYYVDYYLAQINNGGFSQFVYNTQWNPSIINFVRNGLRMMGATQHQLLFEEGANLVKRLRSSDLDDYFNSEYFGENETRDQLNLINKRFYALSDTEDLISLNSAWLRKLPNLLVLPIIEMESMLSQISSLIPDRESRVNASLAREPIYIKMIRMLCNKANQKFEYITVGTPIQMDNGYQLLAWHFFTDKGHFYMIETDDEAIMFDATTKKIIVSLPVNEITRNQ